MVNDQSGSSISLNGSHCVAGNVNGVEPVSVGKVLFNPVSVGGSIADNGVAVSVVDLGNGLDYFDYDRTAAFYAANSGLSSLMGSSFKSAYYSNGIGIKMSGLEVGQKYQLQGFFWDGGPNTSLFVRNASDHENRGNTLETSAPAQGYYWLATWIADAEEMTMEVRPGRSSRSVLSAFSLRSVDTQ